VPSPRHPGILQTLPVVYLRETRQWAPREAAFVHGPDDPERFVTQWNHHCIQCHSTGGNPGLDKPSGQLRTQVAELGISCESCHGPGQAHVDLRRSLPKGVRPDHERIINPDDLSPQRSSEVCGQCHGVFLHRDEFAFDFAEHGILFRPGEVLERTRYYPRFPQPGSPESVWADLRQNPQFFKNRWWPDGQMMAAGREFSAMRESGCHSKGGMSCLTCHSMHSSDPDDQLRRDRNSSASCLECHREETYTTRISSHTHHAPTSSGSDCLNCHMPHTSYALFKAIRNHQISSPTVNPVERGTPPNACNLCHLDRTLEWTQDWLTRWYDRKPAAPLVSNAQSEVREVRIAKQFGISYLPLMIMEDQRLIEKHAAAQGLPGLRTNWLQFAGGAPINDALISGSLEFAGGGVGPMITLWARTRANLGVRGVASLNAMPLYLNTVNPNVRTIRDFTDRDRIGLPAVRVSIQAVTLQMACEAAFGPGQHGRLDGCLPCVRFGGGAGSRVQ